MKYDVKTTPSIKQSDTPIDVNGNITPITQQQVNDLRPDLWNTDNVSLEFLNSQMSILNQRMEYAVSMRQNLMVKSLQEGIAKLESAITEHLLRENN